MDHHDEATTPTTPRPNATSIPRSQERPAPETSPEDIPSSQNLGGIAGQRPLPSPPLAGFSSAESGPGTLSRKNSRRSTQSSGVDNMDMDDSDGDQDGSENESDGEESGRSSKKKKGQRFFCTEFPPCTLSFTRSEHLARHIRFVETCK